ncbi:peptidylprolyl isomerase [candidate division KSB1 bacterium]
MKIKTTTTIIVSLIISSFIHCTGAKETMRSSEPAIAERVIASIDNFGPVLSPAPSVLSSRDIADLKQKVSNLPLPTIEKGEYAVLETSMGFIVFELLTDAAPSHCAHFKKLANSGFYDWITFHRVIPGYLIQTGSITSRNSEPRDDGTGSPGYTINAEISDLKHERGIVSMARQQNINSAGSQFFILLSRASQLDGEYTIFGRVLQGMDIVRRIVRVDTDDRDRPVKNVYLKRARVVKP